MKGEFSHASESFKRLNPGLFSHCGGVGNPKRECNQRSETQDRGVGEVQTGMGFRITILSMRARLIDGHDNLKTGAKALVDRVTEWLGFRTDSDPRLEWNYAQCQTSGRRRTFVLIERIP